MIMLLMTMMFGLVGTVSATDSLTALEAYMTAKVYYEAHNSYATGVIYAKTSYELSDQYVKHPEQDKGNIVTAVAKKGMEISEALINEHPEKVEGWYWYAMCSGTYAESVSIFKAISEGLLGKARKAGETAYAIDKYYEEGGPIVYLARFSQAIPKIAGRNLAKAESLYMEYIAHYEKKNPRHEIWYFLGELYQEKGNKQKARDYYATAIKMGSELAIGALRALQ